MISSMRQTTQMGKMRIMVYLMSISISENVIWHLYIYKYFL